MQTCGSAAPSPVWGGLNVGFQPRGMGGSRLQRKSAIRGGLNRSTQHAQRTSLLAFDIARSCGGVR
jgi:hypothetical protein